MTRITAVIPVRKGSQRVKNKSIRPFSDTTLLDLKIKNLKKVSNIDNIVVNTDSEEAIQIARNNNVDFHIRDTYYASDSCTNSEFLEHLGLVTETDFFAYCPCTSPFIYPKTIEESISFFLVNLDKFDSFATTSLVKEFLWFEGNPINYERDKQPNSQNLPNIQALNFGLNIISRTNLIAFKNIVGLKPCLKIIDSIQGIDIDTTLDFFFAERLFEGVKSNPNFLDYY